MNLRTLLSALLVALFASGSFACDKPAAEQEASGESREASEPSQTKETSADIEPIVAALEDDGISDAERLEAIHQAREAGVDEAIPALRSLLNSDNLEIVVAAAAALERLDAQDVGGDIVEAASRMSRSHAFEPLRQLLYIIGDVGGPQARIYLETVAEGHQVPGIRQTAAAVLEDMRPKEMK